MPYGEPILCVAALMLVMWVVVLKAQIADLKKENEKLLAEMQAKVRKSGGKVEISA